MSGRYAPIPNNRDDEDAEHELNAAFGDEDDEDDFHDATESQPLNPAGAAAQRSHRATPSVVTHGGYDFENVDYDYPPPGSPPPPSDTALPNNFGNSNGYIPSFNILPSVSGPHRTWIQRTATRVLPARIADRWGLAPHQPDRAVGDGTNNDGVFANITAKPTRPVRVQQDGDSAFVVPEDVQNEAPPSYASAQADAVPPYWETTVHAPFSPESLGEMIIDALPTGSVFSFLCNALVSISFQFIGFLLTYLLHTTHAARLGSRAGLGVTLIQYGFALRNRLDETEDSQGAIWNQWAPPPNATFSSSSQADAFFNNATSPDASNPDSPFAGLTDEQAGQLVADATTEWLSFFLMTVGWFVLLTSVLGFWRVKRWERSIMSTQTPASGPAATETPGAGRIITQFERTFGLGRFSNADFFRQGFGFGGRDSVDEEEVLVRAEEGRSEEEIAEMLNLAPDDPMRAQRIAEALEGERRLQSDLRAAGLL